MLRNQKQGLVFQMRVTILQTMKATSKSVCIGVGMLALTVPLVAVTPGAKLADYTVIGDRNPFGLVDPPPPVIPVDPSAKMPDADPPPNVELTGFFRDSRMGKTFALFLVEGKEKGAATKKSYMWDGDGKDGDDGIMVLAIDEKNEKVKLRVRGVESTITFSKPKPAAPGQPGAVNPGRPAQGLPNVPGVGGVNMNAGGVRTAETAIQGGSLGRSGSNKLAVGGGRPVQLPTAQMNPSGGLQSIPSRTLRVPAATGQPAGGQQQPDLTPQQQEILIEVNRAVLQQKNQESLFPPLPPTSLTTPEDRARIIVQPGNQNPNPQQ